MAVERAMYIQEKSGAWGGACVWTPRETLGNHGENQGETRGLRGGLMRRKDGGCVCVYAGRSCDGQ